MDRQRQRKKNIHGKILIPFNNTDKKKELNATLIVRPCRSYSSKEALIVINGLQG